MVQNIKKVLTSHKKIFFFFFEGGLGLNIRYFCDAPEYLGVKSDPRFQSCQGGAIYRIGSHMVQNIPKVHTWCNISLKFTHFDFFQGGAIYRIGSHMVQNIPKVHTLYQTSSHMVQYIAEVHTF